MSGRVIAVQKIKYIPRLKDLGVSDRAIVRALDVNGRTVVKHRALWLTKLEPRYLLYFSPHTKVEVAQIENDASKLRGKIEDRGIHFSSILSRLQFPSSFQLR